MVADLETNYDQCTNMAGVWSVCYKNENDKPRIFRRLSDFMNYVQYVGNTTCYFHNLKFDGEFILNYLARNCKYKMAYDSNKRKFKKSKQLRKNEYTYLISDKGVWYAIYLKTKTGLVTILDSLKKAPMSLASAGEAFATEHRKLEMDFNVWMDSEKPLTPKQQAYIENDVYVLEEFLKLFEEEGHTEMTIGSCALKEYKKIIGTREYKHLFPKLSDEEWEFANKAYHGAFIYVNPNYQGKIISLAGKTADVNSLYPFVLHSMSGNYYPVGKGEYWKEHKTKKRTHTMDFIHFRCSFKVRKGKLPFVHIRKNPDYPARKVLETSWIWDRKNESWITHREGKPIVVDFWMQDKELKLFLEHYMVRNFEIIEGYTYQTRIGIFDEYINKYNKIKMESKGGKRTLSKLFLNNLYGKFATKRDSSFKVIDLEKTRETGITHFVNVHEEEKEVNYMPVGACVTSNGMIHIVKNSQKFYEKGVYLYTDTDSIHYIDKDCDNLITIHDTALGAFKIEMEWERAVFLRAKTYIERDKEGKHNIICAGMPEKCKQLLRVSLGEPVERFERLHPSEIGEKFIEKRRTLEDFKEGLRVPDKLLPRHVINGIALESTEFTIKRESGYGRLYG